MMIATCLIGISLLIFLDCYPIAAKEAERLNGGDGYITVSKNIEGITDEKIKELIEDDTDRYYAYHNISFDTQPLTFGDGEVVIAVSINDKSAFDRPMNTFEVVKEDSSVTEDYIYLPYQFYTAGGYDIGDKFEFEKTGKKYSFTIKGFMNVVYGGCNNNGRFAFVVDDASYEKIWNETREGYENIEIIYDLKDGVQVGAFKITASNEMLKINPAAVIAGTDVNQDIGNRTFIGLIIAVSILVLTSLIVSLLR